MIKIALSFELSFATRSNSESRNKSVIYRILSVELLNNLGRPNKLLQRLFQLRRYFKSFLSSRPRNIDKILSQSIAVSSKFTTTYSDTRSNSKARISGLAASTHARNRTLPDLPFAWPWEIWARD